MNEFALSYDLKDTIHIESSGIEIELGKPAPGNVISVGPGLVIPLPLIPWIPGIIQTIRGHVPGMQQGDHLIVKVRFIKSATYLFDPGKVRLIIDNNVFYPTSYTCETLEASSPTPIRKDFEKNNEGQYIIKMLDSHALRVDFNIAFDLTYSSITQAELDLGKIKYNGDLVVIPNTSIKRHKGFQLWWLYTINT